jgi:hypothetical protein
MLIWLLLLAEVSLLKTQRYIAVAGQKVVAWHEVA